MNTGFVNNDFFIIEYVLIAMVAIIIYLIYYLTAKDSLYTKNIRSVATVVEELNREIFYLKQKLQETQKSLKTTTRDMSDEEIYQEVERTVYDMIQPISQGLKNVQETMQAIEMQVEDRLSSLESGVKQISVPSSVHGNDDEKIISLFQQGVALETISKELHLSKAEVEFVLKINKIK